MHVQKFINFGDVFQGEFLEPLEERHALLVTLFDLFEIGTRLVVQRLVRFRFPMKADVQFVERAQAALFHVLAAAPALERGYEFAELRAVITQMVDAHGRISQKFMQFIERTSENGRRKVPDMKGLGDVDGGIVDADGLARSLVGRAVALLFGKDARKRFLRPEVAVDLEIDVAVHSRNFAHEFVRGNRFCDLLGDERGGFSENFRKFKARQGKVAHLRIGRQGEHGNEFVFPDPLYVQFFRDVPFKIQIDLEISVIYQFYHIFAEFTTFCAFPPETF